MSFLYGRQFSNPNECMDSVGIHPPQKSPQKLFVGCLSALIMQAPGYATPPKIIFKIPQKYKFFHHTLRGECTQEDHRLERRMCLFFLLTCEPLLSCISPYLLFSSQFIPFPPSYNHSSTSDPWQIDLHALAAQFFRF